VVSFGDNDLATGSFWVWMLATGSFWVWMLDLPGGKGRPAHKDDDLTAICERIV
jgi:hypothetical protein